MEEKDKGGCDPPGRSHAAWEHGGGTDACGRRKRYLHKSQRDDEHPVQIHCRDFIRNGRLCCWHLSVFNVFLEKQEYGGRIYRLIKEDCCVLDLDHADGIHIVIIDRMEQIEGLKRYQIHGIAGYVTVDADGKTCYQHP